MDHRRSASTSTSQTDWLSWLRKAASARSTDPEVSKKALLFAGLGAYPHTPSSPTAASIAIWEQASEALLEPDMTIGYEPKGMEEFAGRLSGGSGVRAWLRGWVEGRNLTELMRRPDVTAAFVLASSIAILASEQEHNEYPELLPPGTAHLAGYGFIGTITALVAAGRLDLQTGVRLARLMALLPSRPPKASLENFTTTVLSARHFHSLSSPSMFVPFDDPLENDGPRRRCMQLILDEIHSMQEHWEAEGNGEWAAASVISSSKVLSVTGTDFAVHAVIDRCQDLNLANPVMDLLLPCPYHTKLMAHAEKAFKGFVKRCYFTKGKEGGPTIWDPLTTKPMDDPAEALQPYLTSQLRWHKTLSRLYAPPVTPPIPLVDQFLTVGKGARGLGVQLRGELRKLHKGSDGHEVGVEEYGPQASHNSLGERRGARREVNKSEGLARRRMAEVNRRKGAGVAVGGNIRVAA